MSRRRGRLEHMFEELFVPRETHPGGDPVSEWAVPGVPRPEAPDEPPATVSGAVRAVEAAVAGVRAQDPAVLSGAQALAEARVLLCEAQALQAVGLARLGDVDRRRLHDLDGAPSTGAWVAGQQLGLDVRLVTLARRLEAFPMLATALQAGRVVLPIAQRLQTALSKLRPFLDRADGLIDGQPCEQALTGVIGNGVGLLIAECRGGFASDDDQLRTLERELQAILSSSASQLGRLEAALLVLAREVEPGQLPACLGVLTDALLPVQLAERERHGHEARRLRLVKKADGSGWRLEGELDLECGERLHAFLQSELARDPDNPLDTALAAQLREQGVDPGDPDQVAAHAAHARQERRQDRGGAAGGAPAEDTDADPDQSDQEVREDPEDSATRQHGGSYDWHGGQAAGPGGGPDGGGTVFDDAELWPPSTGGFEDLGEDFSPVPRSRAQRMHDALSLGLARYLAAGLGGQHDKNPVQVVVTVGLDALRGDPGALPARGATGASLSIGTVRRWACDCLLTRQVLSLAGKVLEVSHTERTLKAAERRAKLTETSGTCQAAGCTRSTRTPGQEMHFHHGTPWAGTGSTSLADGVLLCKANHADVHGGRTIRLKDGRYLGPDGWAAVP